MLTPRPAEVPAWEEYPDRYKPVAARLMEVFAGFMAHTDEQVGRLLDSLDEMGEADNTLFTYITGDNGASAEGTVNGAWRAPSFQNGLLEDPEAVQWPLRIKDAVALRSDFHHVTDIFATLLDDAGT